MRVPELRLTRDGNFFGETSARRDLHLMLESHARREIATRVGEVSDSYTILPEQERLVAAGWNPALTTLEVPD
jgi:hypothetical protein